MKIMQIGTGMDLSIALELASREDTEVYYFSEWNSSFPQVESYLVGFGFDRFGIKLVQDFYSILNSVPDDERDSWLILITDTGFGDLPNWLRDENWAVFGPGKKGQDLETNRAFGKDFMLSNGIDIASYYTFETLIEVEDTLTALIDNPKQYVLKVNTATGLTDTAIGTPSELLDKLEDLDNIRKDLKIGYTLEEFIPGIEVGVTAFFNGDKFITPVIGNYESEWGGYLYWTDESVVFKMGLQNAEQGLKNIGYNGVIDLNGIFVRKNAWAKGIPLEDRYAGLEFTSRFGYPYGRVYTKMIGNLTEMLDGCARGEVPDVETINSHAYFINAFANLELADTEDFVDINKIYTFERDNPEKWGISFDKVVMQSDGNVAVLPGYPRMFQMIGFGDSYFSAVENCLELYELCKKEVEFEDHRDLLVPDIRDRVIFLESWT